MIERGCFHCGGHRLKCGGCSFHHPRQPRSCVWAFTRSSPTVFSRENVNKLIPTGLNYRQRCDWLGFTALSDCFMDYDSTISTTRYSVWCWLLRKQVPIIEFKTSGKRYLVMCQELFFQISLPEGILDSRCVAAFTKWTLSYSCQREQTLVGDQV